MRAVVVSLQGAVPEHVTSLLKAFEALGIDGHVVQARRASDVAGADCVIIPGGESTTISKLLTKTGMRDVVLELAESGTPIMGTCAGCILMAKEGDVDVARTGTELLGLMEMRVRRNSFGRQRESFETMIDIEGLEAPFPAVFIRGPHIEDVWGGCETLGSLDGRTVIARQGNNLALSFHPELTGDTRLHEMLIGMI